MTKIPAKMPDQICPYDLAQKTVFRVRYLINVTKQYDYSSVID
jgi:hypothetical protein